MASSDFGTVLRRWLQSLDGSANSQASDGQLLERFVQQRDEAAFAALVRRHGPLVYGVCRKVLRNGSDADDAFQATFLVLACRAASIRRRESVASFLYGVATRIARHVKEQNARRSVLHRRAASDRPEAFLPPDNDGETHSLLHEELNLLPSKYRDVLILCYLQGKTSEEAARELGHPVGSMSRHLSRARELLRQRLLARGVGAGVLATVWTAERVSAALVYGTLDTIRHHALASALMAGASPPMAVVLAQGILRTAWLTRTAVASLVLTLSLVFAGGMAAFHTTEGKETTTATNQPTELPEPIQKGPALDRYGDPLPEGALKRFGSTRLRHVGRVLALAWSPDGKLVASSGEEGVICLRDSVTGRLVRSIKSRASCLAFTPEGKGLAAGLDGRVCIWETATGKELLLLDALSAKLRQLAEQRKQFRGPGGDLIDGRFYDSNWFPRTQTIAFSPDGRLLAAAGVHSTIVWDMAAKRQRFTLDLESAYIAFTPDGKQLVTANGAKSIRLWDARTGKQTGGFETEGPDGWANTFSLAVSPDGKHAALKLLNHLVIVKLDSGKVVWREKSYGYQKEPVAFSPDGRLLAFFSAKGVRVWEWSTGRQIESLADATSVGVFAPDGKRLAWAEGGQVHIYDLKKRKDFPSVERCPASGLFALRPDGKAFVAGVTLWDTISGRVLCDPRFTTPGTLLCVAFSRDGRRLFVGDYSSTITEVDLTGEEKPRSRTGSVKDHYVIALAPGGERAIAHDGHGHLTHTIADCGRDWRERPGQRVNVRDAVYTSDGKRLIVNSDDSLVYLDAVADRVLWRSEKSGGRFNSNYFSGSLAGSPDGRLVAAGSEWQWGPPHKGCVRLFDSATGVERAKLATPHHCIHALAFSPDSRLLVAASTPYPFASGVSADEAKRVVVSLWEVASGAEIRRFHGHEHLIDGLAFAPDGRTFYSASEDSTVLQWDVFGLGVAVTKPEQLDGLWNDLGSRDAAKAYRAITALLGAPKQTVAFLKTHLHPVPDVEAKHLARLIADLDEERFAVREKATEGLTSYGDRAESALRKTLEEKPSLEVRRRIEAILEQLNRPLTGKQLRNLRAIEVLEHIGTLPAQEVLQEIARGAPVSRPTREAKAALRRSANRNPLPR